MRAAPSLRLAVIAGVLLLAAFACPPARADALTDSETVFCLSADNRKSLADAGVALRVLSAGSTSSDLTSKHRKFSGVAAIESWRSEAPSDFNKACKALVKSTALSQGNSPKEESKLSFLSWLLPIVIGALLTMLATEMQGARARKLAAAEQIRIATADFRDALNQYITSWLESSPGGKPSTSQVDQRRLQLIVTLRKAGLRGEWPFVGRLISHLEEPQYGRNIDEGWTGPLSSKQSKADEMRRNLGRLEADSELVASTIASTIPLWMRTSRKKSPSVSSVSP